MTVITDGYVTIDVTNLTAYQKTRDNSYYVQIPASGASIASCNLPGFKNVRGTNTALPGVAATLLGSIVPGDTITVFTPNASATRTAYWDVPGRPSVHANAVSLVFGAFPPTANMLRPPGIGQDPFTLLLRSNLISESQVNLSKLPSIVNVASLPVSWGSFGKAEPTISYLTALLRDFGGECWDGWSTDDKTPDYQHPGYGTYYSSVISQALVQLCSTATVAEKAPLAYAMVQRGLDLAGAFSDGRVNYSLGGHMQGRKALLILAGHLLDLGPLYNPTLYIGNKFQEDIAFFETRWWHTCECMAGWRYNADTAAADGSLLKSHPNSWGSVSTTSTWAWFIDSYLSQVIGSQIGTALGMRLLNSVSQMSIYLDKMTDQWMKTAPISMSGDLTSVSINLPWGEDYAVSHGGDFCKEAWKMYSI